MKPSMRKISFLLPEEKIIALNIPAWDKGCILQGTDKSDPASAQEV